MSVETVEAAAAELRFDRSAAERRRRPVGMHFLGRGASATRNIFGWIVLILMLLDVVSMVACNGGYMRGDHRSHLRRESAEELDIGKSSWSQRRRLELAARRLAEFTTTSTTTTRAPRRRSQFERLLGMSRPVAVVEDARRPKGRASKKNRGRPLLTSERRLLEEFTPLQVEGGGEGNVQRQSLSKQSIVESAPIPFESCCPTIPEMVEPVGGVNKSGEYVHLYQDGGVRQRLHEVSCHPNFEGKPCRFVSQSKASRCVQEYSFSYALVRSHERESWRMDYIKVRSGCGCQVEPLKRRRRQKLI